MNQQAILLGVLNQERAEKWLEFREESRDYAVRFPSDVVFRRADQWLSIILGVGIVATYVGLLGHKHMGWFSADALQYKCKGLGLL